MSTINIKELYSLLTQFSSAILSSYQGEAKESLVRYKDVMLKIKDRPDNELNVLLKPQIEQIITFYNTNKSLIIKDRILEALNEHTFNLCIKLGSPAFIPISDVSIEACIKDSTKDMDNIEGYMYSLLNVCLEDTSEIYVILSRYTKNAPDLGKVGDDMDKVAAGIMSRISINDPDIQSKAESLGATFMNSLKDVVGVSIVELEKQGIDMKEMENGQNVSVAKFIPILSSLIQNPKVSGTIENSIKKMGGQEKIGQMINGVLASR